MQLSAPNENITDLGMKKPTRFTNIKTQPSAIGAAKYSGKPKVRLAKKLLAGTKIFIIFSTIFGRTEDSGSGKLCEW